MFFSQLGQVLPGSLLYISLLGSLGVTATPALNNFVDEAEQVSISHARSALVTSISINKLISRNKNSLVINGEEVFLVEGYPAASEPELAKMMDFGTQTLQSLSSKTAIIWSKFQSYCFTYTEASFTNGMVSSPSISDIDSGDSPQCHI